MSKVTELTKEIETLKSQVAPLQSRVQVLQAAINAIQGQRNAAFDQVAGLQVDLAIARSNTRIESVEDTISASKAAE